jgi:hypothetical protein
VLSLDPVAGLALADSESFDEILVGGVAECGVGVRKRSFVWGNGDYPPFGGPESIANLERWFPMGFEVALGEQKAILNALLLATVWKPGFINVKLFKNDVVPTKDSIVGDFTEADFGGYADIDTLDLHTPALDNEDNHKVVAKTTCHFEATDAVTPNVIYGYYVIDGLGVFLGAERLAESQTMAKAGDSIDFTFQFGYPDPLGAIVES